MKPDLSPANLTVRLARSDQDVLAAQRLRYRVFVQELGATPAPGDQSLGVEADAFDPYSDHLLLEDIARPTDPVVGVYRLLRQDQAAAAGGFYSAKEYDLGPLERTGRLLLELGRSCLHPDYRGGPGMFLLWSALAGYVAEHGIAILFGVASFHGTDQDRLAAPLSLLFQNHLAPPELRVRPRGPDARPMDLLPPGQYDRRQAMIDMPPLIKAYLRLGGVVGDGAWVDHAFNTTDICMILDTARMSPAQKAIYAKGGRG